MGENAEKKVESAPLGSASRNAVAQTPRSPFLSFWQAGFEGADHINGSSQPLCMNSMTDHYRQAPADYGRLAVMGLATVRESASWRQIDRKGRYDVSKVKALCRVASERGLQVLWTCFHYGMPDDVDIFSDRFAQRLADYCHVLAHTIRRYRRDDLPSIYTPINEISFLAWAVCETGLIHPHLGNRAEEGYALKRHLVKACIQAADAIWAADPDARMLIVDPLVYASPSCDEEASAAAAQNGFQYQAWDMLAGALEPGLGGSNRYLDLIGVNYYHSNQWDYGSRLTLAWPTDARRKPLSVMLEELYLRYQRPLTLSETSHTGLDRAPWLEDVASQVRCAMDRGVDINGICLYPALDRPDWEHPTDWHASGLWHVHPHEFHRRIDPLYATALGNAKAIISSHRSSPVPH